MAGCCLEGTIHRRGTTRHAVTSKAVKRRPELRERKKP
jgi:hypothetical protein